MPYLNSKLSEKHRASCKDPKAKRVYIRDYDEDRKKQIFIPYGITCPSCRVIILDSETVKSFNVSQAQTQIQVKPKISKELKPKNAKKMAVTQPAKRDKKYKERKKIVAGFATPNRITDCIICNQPTTASYDGFRGMTSDEAHRYGGQGVGFFYPGGIRVDDSEVLCSMKQEVCCRKCHEKHFEQSSNNPKRKRGEPITALAKKIVAEKCTIPYPAETETNTTTSQQQKKPKPKTSKNKVKEMSVKELSKLGEVGSCAICNRNILLSFIGPLGYPPGLLPGAKYHGQGIAKYYPDGKHAEYFDSKTMKWSEWPSVCQRCHKKHFERHGQYGFPFTEEARRVAIIPYSETKI